MLYTDSDIVTAAMMRQIDGEIDSLAAGSKGELLVEGVGAICEQAWRECGQAVMSAQQLYSTYLAQPGVTTGHLAAVLNTGVPARAQARCRLNQIVAHDQNYSSSLSALQLWMAYTALSLLFREASSRLGKDRYQEKFERYRHDAARVWLQLRSVGLPMIYQPLEAPGAKHGFNAGAWGESNLSSGGTVVAASEPVLVAITWYDASRYTGQSSKGNAESAPSEIIGFTIPANQLLSVSIASLNPPNGMDPVGYSHGAWSPLTATHWNIYVGRPASTPIVPPTLYLQKEGIPVATKTWQLAAVPSYTGNILQAGQFPDLNIVFQNIVLRG